MAPRAMVCYPVFLIMKHLVFILSFVISAALSGVAVRASDTSTVAVLYMSGYMDASQEVTAQRAALLLPNPDPLPKTLFRTMALFNMNIMFILINAEADPLAIEYMRGRVDAFNQAADTAGEPEVAQ